MALDKLLGYSSFLICKLETMQDIKKLGGIGQLYLNTYVSWIFN